MISWFYWFQDLKVFRIFLSFFIPVHPRSYYFTLDNVIICFILLALSSLVMFSSDGSLLKFSSHSFKISSARRSCAFRFVAITLLYLIVVCLILYLIRSHNTLLSLTSENSVIHFGCSE